MDAERIFIKRPTEHDGPRNFRRPRLTPPATWLAAAVLLLAAAGVLIWCFGGTVATSVRATGVVFPQYGIEQVNSQVDGLVTYVQVEVGDTVQAGDLLAIVPQQELLEQIEAARAAQAPQEELDRLYEEYQTSSMIYTSISGRVVDLVQEGSAISAGELVAGITSADRYSNEAEIRAYVPSTVAQSIKKGMEVRVYPGSADGEDYGAVQGLVSEIYDYPITETDISEALGRFYTSEIVPQNENIVEVRVTLLAGSEEQAGTWSSAEGGKLTIETGTLCDLEVITSEMTPWAYIRS